MEKLFCLSFRFFAYANMSEGGLFQFNSLIMDGLEKKTTHKSPVSNQKIRWSDSPHRNLNDAGSPRNS